MRTAVQSSESEPRAWWADAADLRERIEQRRDGDRTPAKAAVATREQPARRTVRISGRGAPAPEPRPLVPARTRAPRGQEAFMRRPDRIAGWAALLGLVLVLVASTSH